MLRKFAVKNFRGFGDRVELDLSTPNHYDFNVSSVKDGIIRNGIIYGENGSGKSNFGIAMFDLVNHLTQNITQQGYYTNFTNACNPMGAVEFEYSFRLGVDIVDYLYTKDAKGNLLSEQFMVNGDLYLNRKDNEIMSLEFNMTEMVKEAFVNGRNSVSIVNFILANYPLPKNHILMRFRTFVDSMLWYKCLDSREFIGLEKTVSTNIESEIIENGLTDDFMRFLKEVSGQDFNLVVDNQGNAVSNNPTLLAEYRIDDAKFSRLPFFEIASTGTRALELLYFWIQKASKVSLLFIDEFDAFYHHALSFKVCQMLFSMTNCQVFLTTHNTFLMSNELLRGDCLFILSDNKIKSLSDLTNKELREANNLEKMYRGGAFKQ